MKLMERKLIDNVRQGRQWWCRASRGRVQMRPLLLLVLAVLIAMVSAGCNSGGDSTPQTNTFSGTVMAPGGAVASLQKDTLANSALALLFGEELQAAVTGMTGVSGATVELIQIGNDGKQVGDVIASATTDSSGGYSITTTASPASNLVLRVSGASESVRAFAVSGTVTISPVSEYLVQQILATVSASSSVALTNFNATELGILADFLDSLSVYLPPGTIADALTTINSTAMSAGMGSEIALYSPDGLHLAGDWRYREYTGANNCGDPVGELWSDDYLTITQSGNSLSVTSGGTAIATLRLSGYDIVDIPLDSYSDGGGTTTETAMTLSVEPDGLTINGEISWNWTNGTFSCSGKSTVLVTKV